MRVAASSATASRTKRRRTKRMPALLVRTVETLALAVEAHGGHGSRRLESIRVKAQALAIGRLMGLGSKDLDALCVAAMVRSFGELAGPEELEKTKIHPSIGAAIAEHVQFPFPVAPIVRSHHERWDGSGYPDGLKGKNIPLGARILAAADCLAALPPAEALDALLAGAGSGFDPDVVRVVAKNHARLQRGAKRAAASLQPAFHAAIAAARHEERSIAALKDELGSSLSLHETLSVFDAALKPLIAYDCIAVYLPGKDRLSPTYINGVNPRLFCSLEIPYGQGPSGRAASTRQPVLTQDPSAAGGCIDDPALANSVRATLAVPLESRGELIGVLALYHASPGVFSAADLRILVTVRAKLARAMENALKHERAEQVSAVDPLTAVSNTRGLFLRLDAELARCRRNHAELAVVVCHVAGLKQIQQRFGPLACAPLHQSIASGLRRICREDDCIARLEDEFVLVLGGFQEHDLEEKRKLIESLLDQIGDSDLGARVLTPRLGAAFFPEDGAYAEDLLATAGLRLNRSRPPVGQDSRPVVPIC